MPLMNFFRKRITIEYHPMLQKKEVEDMVKKIPYNFPSYFSSIPKTINNLRYFQTVKTCPGFINLYKRSLLITSPFDLQVDFDEHKIVKQTLGQTDYQVATLHPNDQLLTYANTNEYKFIMKITLPFIINSDVSFLTSPACYHFNNFDVFSGIVNAKYKRDMNFFIPIKKNQKELYIKKGEGLFLITPLCENKIKLDFKQKYKMYPTLTFSTLKKQILEKLIDG